MVEGGAFFVAKRKKICSFFLKNLYMYKKSSTFVADFYLSKLMKKHVFSFVMLLLFTFAFSHRALAYDEWDGTTVSPIVSASVIEVYTAADLAGVAALSATEDLSGTTIELKADIDLKSKPWTPIGSAAFPFKGTFLGNGHLIRGLRAFAGANDGVGLFGHVGQGGRIEQVGISGGLIMAKNRRHIGAIAGVCDGTVKECWSMAEMVATGNITGGLVGELESHGAIIDCYQSGLIYNPSDTTGCIVGLNTGGTLTRVYNSGYALGEEAHAIVGISTGGSYSQCYFDRKAYMQKPGVEGNVITPIDSTALMFPIFSTAAAWSTSTTRYPILNAFAATNAAALSAAPMFLETENVDPVEHADGLTRDFNVSIEGGITWACQKSSDEQWLHFNNTTGDVAVVRPCAANPILVNSMLGDETRVVYLNPLKLEDLLPGAFNNSHDSVFCYNDETLLKVHVDTIMAKQGWVGDGDYHYQIVLFKHDGTDFVPVDTLLEDATPAEFATWYKTAMVPTYEAGHYLMRGYVHDNGCVLDWMENQTGFEFVVYEEMDPGEIESRKDTIILNGIYNFTVHSVADATGGSGKLSYKWYENGEKLEEKKDHELSYSITKKNTTGYIYTRMAVDEECGEEVSDGEYIIYAFDPLDPGEIADESDLTFCTLEDAKKHVIDATAASGAIEDKGYMYQWYMNNQAISGATAEDLALNTVSALAAGNTYTFTRQAKDSTNYTVWTDSRKSKKIRIMAVLTPGAIEAKALSVFCFEADATAATEHTIRINESTAAICADGLKYRWVRTGDDGSSVVLPVTTKDLDYTFRKGDIQLGVVYTYTREVNNTEAKCGYEPSTGVVQVKYGQKTYEEVVTTICANDLPYTMKLEDGTELYFRTETDTKRVIDDSGECPHETVYKIELAKMPTVTVNDKVIGWCQGSGHMGVSYTDDPTIPSNTFLITFSDDLAAIIGKKDTIGDITTPGYIEFANIPYLPSDKILYITLQLGYQSDEAEGVCYSKSSDALYLSPSIGGYLYSKYDRVVFVDNNPDNGALADSIDNKLRFDRYQWYKNGYAQEGQTNQYYHEGGTVLVGVFYCMLHSVDGGTYRTCDITLPSGTTSSAPQFSAVYPVPVNAGDALTIETFGSAQIFSFSGERVANIGNVDGKAVISAPYMAGIYYVQIMTETGELEMHKLIVK